MASDSRDRQHEAGDKPGQHDANTCPIHGVAFVVAPDGAGKATLDVISAPLEQTYRIGEEHGTRLFLALCRSRGLLPYRHRRSHAGTISVRASLAEHDALWARYLELDRELQIKLTALTLAFVKSKVGDAPK
ncbi:MAG: hypothetical protein RL701_1770 [Pseudomonadota bacterium]|jgi:hypothetical protein